MVEEITGQTYLRLTSPVEAGDVLRVNHGRDHFVARADALAVKRHERPVLTGEQVPTAVAMIPIDRAVNVADARVEAVAFVRVGRLSAAEEVEFALHRQRGVLVRLALGEQRQTALPR